MVIVIGDINVDIMMAVSHWPTEGSDAATQTLTWSNGGTGLNAATAIARMGGRVRLWGRIGADPAATQVRAFALNAGIDLQDMQQDAHIPTGLCVIPVTPGGERTFLSFRGANQHWQVPPHWPVAPHWLMVCGHALLDDPQRHSAILALQYAQQQGWHTVIDVCERLTPHLAAVMAQLSTPLTVLCGNQSEMQALAHLPVAQYAHTRIIKCGAAGADAHDATQHIHVPGFAVDAVDSTGCGDTFVAVCTWALCHGASLPEALTVANAAGALAACRWGAADIVPTRADVIDMLQQHAITVPAWVHTPA